MLLGQPMGCEHYTQRHCVTLTYVVYLVSYQTRSEIRLSKYSHFLTC